MSRREDLARHWVHSHEEDTPEEFVYRPASYRFPPSRGRTALDLRPDGTYGGSDIGADDRPSPTSGNWSIGDDDELVLTGEGTGQPHRTLRIASVTPERLTIRR